MTGAHLLSQDDAEEPPGYILVIYNTVERVVRGEAHDLLAEQEVIQTAQAIAAALRAAGHRVIMAPVWEDIGAVLEGYDPHDVLVFNLCESLGGRSEDEPKVPATLDQWGFHYTGSSGPTIATCLNKAQTKALLAQRGVPTAPYQVFYQPTDPLNPDLLPAIVKPLAEDASHGISRDSVVHTPRQLRERVDYILRTYQQPALVEAFIPGREFNVGIWGNGTLHVLPLSELDFSYWTDPYQRVCHYDAKWNPQAVEYYTMPVLCPAPVERELAARIREVALRAYRATGCRDYARVDLRVADGVPYVLEVNPNPCLAPDAGFFNAARVAGYGYAEMAERIVRLAWRRRHLAWQQQPASYVQYRPGHLSSVVHRPSSLRPGQGVR